MLADAHTHLNQFDSGEISEIILKPSECYVRSAYGR